LIKFGKFIYFTVVRSYEGPHAFIVAPVCGFGASDKCTWLTHEIMFSWIFFKTNILISRLTVRVRSHPAIATYKGAVLVIACGCNDMINSGSQDISRLEVNVI
jgi:hypothetical protein